MFKTFLMKKIFLLTLFIIILSATSPVCLAQSNLAYAFTGEVKGNVNWTVIRELDLSTGSLVRNIYVPSTQKPLIYDALTRKLVNNEVSIKAQATSLINPLQTMVAATAYDAKYNRLYYTPIQGLELRYFDLTTGTQKVFYVRHQLLKQFAVKPGEEDNITRMTFAADGYGYALTNNADHLIRFSTGQKIQITDMGSLMDGSKNGNYSVHSPCASWGGDMIADAFGNLFLFTAKGNIFKINPQTLVANYYGTIKKLSNDFTVNAAAVNAEGDVVISCATNAANYYRLNLATMEAVAIGKKDEILYNASDFANANLLYQKEAINTKIVPAPEMLGNELVTIYPNPVSHRNFTIEFNTSIKGKCSIQLIDITGRSLLLHTINVSGKQTEKINLPANALAGMYVLKINAASGKKIYTDKIVVE